MPDPSVSENQQFPGDPILNRFFLTPEQKKQKETGRNLLRAIYAAQTGSSDNLNYFRARNAKQINNLLWAKGSQPMQEFLDYMDISDANMAYVNIDTTPSRIASQFVNTLVRSMSKTKLYACVKAIDDGSMKDKEERMFDALFRMHEVQTINDIQQKSGVQIEPTNAYVPNDPIAAKVYFQLEDQLPKEIRFEEMLKKLAKDINFEKVANPKTLYDLIVLNVAALKIEKIGVGDYTIRRCIPTNMIYNFFMNDTGVLEVTQIGEFTNIKVRDFRTKFGRTDQRPDGLSEKEIFELAKLSSTKNIGTFNFNWQDNWGYASYNMNRPYDDNSILVLDMEVDFGEDVYFVEKTDAYGKKNIVKKSAEPYKPQVSKSGKVTEYPKPDNVEVIKRKKNTWMRGVWAPYGDTMLYWGEPDVIISQYTDVYHPLSSYVINIPNNDGEYVPSLLERGMDVLHEFQLTKLKLRQLIALIKPSGVRIDVARARNIDLGSGNTIRWQEVLRIYNQTGTEVYSSEGVDPLQQQSAPLANTVRDESVEKIIGLNNALAGMVNELRTLWGVPQYRDGSDVGDRTAAALAEGQNQSASNVTDFISVADSQLWEEAFYRVCLLKWNDIVKTEPESSADLVNTRFDVRVEVRSTEVQQQQLEADIQRYSQVQDAQGNPALSPKDAMMLREIGAENYKLARWYMVQAIEDNRQKSMQESQQLQQQNQQLQAQTAQQSGQQAQDLQTQKIQSEKEMLEFKSSKEKELALLQGVFAVASKSGVIPAEFMPAINALVPNILTPLVQENQQMNQQVVAQQQQAAAQQQQQAMPQGQPQSQPQPQQQIQQPQQ